MFVLLLISAIPAFLSCAAYSQVPPGMVLMPKALADAAITLIEREESVRIRDALRACEASNSEKALTPDQCPSVTNALKTMRDTK